MQAKGSDGNIIDVAIRARPLIRQPTHHRRGLLRRRGVVQKNRLRRLQGREVRPRLLGQRVGGSALHGCRGFFARVFCLGEAFPKLSLRARGRGGAKRPSFRIPGLSPRSWCSPPSIGVQIAAIARDRDSDRACLEVLLGRDVLPRRGAPPRRAPSRRRAADAKDRDRARRLLRGREVLPRRGALPSRRRAARRLCAAAACPVKQGQPSAGAAGAVAANAKGAAVAATDPPLRRLAGPFISRPRVRRSRLPRGPGS